MAIYVYDGDDYKDVVKQNSTYDYDEIYTYGGNDEIRVVYDDTLVKAGSGDDIISIYSSSADFYGDSGNDEFYAIADHNYINGGTGRDLVSYSLQDDSDFYKNGVLVNLAKGEATLDEDNYDELVNIEDVEGTSAADTITGNSGSNRLWGMDGNDFLDGAGGNDTIYGENGNDKIYGDTGADRLYGGNNNDTLYGESGDDDLYGGTGNDKLYGGTGNDLLYGNAGNDRFIFTSKYDSVAGSNRDVIADFSPDGDDMIDLSKIDADTSTSGNQAFKFIGTSGFHDVEGELRYVKSGTSSIIQGDINGDGTADFEIKVNGISKMFVDDFVL